MTDAVLPPATPAATVVIFRNCPQGGPPELLLVQRSREMRFAGGAVVFPGGKVDPQDHELAARLLPDMSSFEAAARVAAVRETLEETGLIIAVDGTVTAAEAAAARAMLLEAGALAPVLERFGWTLALDRLVPFARWCPKFERAFDTYFFLADLGTGAVDIVIDATENTRLFWASAAKALEMAEAGEISMIFPTLRNLDRLAQFSSFAEARAHSQSIPVRTITPWLIERDGQTWLTIPDDCGYPVTEALVSKSRRG